MQLKSDQTTNMISPYAEIDRVILQLNKLIFGKEMVVRLALCCMIAKGHLLIEDVPGCGKTTLVKSLASMFGLAFQRVQFTSDLLPADILGSAIYNQNTGVLDFHPGPIFCECVLADEINRATPRTQSALLEAMSEEAVHVEGKSRALPQPFFVMATQNPSTQIGTFPLPESQLDRFLMCIHIGYPDSKSERTLLQEPERKELLANMKPVVKVEDLLSWQQQASKLHVSDALLDYLQQLLKATRQQQQFLRGLSPRAGLGVLSCSKAWAFMDGRDFVMPDDIQAVFVSVVAHRFSGPGQQGATCVQLVQDLIEQIEIP